MVSEADQIALADGEWKAIPRVSRVVPFGYELDPHNPNMLIPIPFELEALEKAKLHVKRFSYREVAAWLSNVTGRSISHVGLKKRIEVERSRRSKVKTLKQWANRIEEAKAKVEKYESQSLGASD